MKKVGIAVLVVAAVAFAGMTYAFDLKVPTSAKDVKDMGGKAAVQTALNKKVESSGCAFKKGTADTTCDLNKLGNELAAAYRTAKETANYDIAINVTADNATGKKAISGYDRANSVCNKLKNSPGKAILGAWNYNCTSGGTGDGLAIKVDVH